ncbi:MAG: DUF1549 domain-containing protein [Verrucomicrobiota bacterium]
MKTQIALVLTASILLTSPTTSSASEDFNVAKAAKKIDSLVEAGLKANDLEPNDSIDDATFLRRVYLDIIGRVPTIEEAENFHGSTYERKREQLITDLLESEGHVSRAYNFWADILRINRGLGNNNARQAQAAYELWVKESIENNVPFDEMVRELVAAEGMIWDNGAVGYYIRDRGMPLDNMSNTVRVFLGTRLECAQCHDHPFDKWTQMDYYQMAAFSYGMDARRYDSPNRDAYTQFTREERNAAVEKAVKMEGFPLISNESQLKRAVENKNYERTLERLGINDRQFRNIAKRSIEAYQDYDHDSRIKRNVVNDLYNPLQYVQANEKVRTLKLPHDYQYNDAKPHDPISPRTMFGEDIEFEEIDQGMIDQYAEWMTSKENPTFTKVIANRLWKHVFGQGVFEPVDELTDHTPVANPELLGYLEEVMRELDYDMRKYQEVLFNTETYQRTANQEEVVLGAPYHFQGPLLRRMSAEQIWDSIVALALPEADLYRPKLTNQLDSVKKVRSIYDSLEGRSEKEFIAMVKEVTEVYLTNKPKEEKLRAKLYEAREEGNEELYRKLQRDLNSIRGETRRALSEIAYRETGKKADASDLLAAMGMSEMMMSSDGEVEMSGGGLEQAVLLKLPKPEMPEAPEGLERNQLKAWQTRMRNEQRLYTSLVSNMARSSELDSPAPRGHFLREFGQSDREVIENASYYASVPQALNLLNGPIVEALTNQFAVFGKRVHAAGDPEEKVQMIFQAMLTREPTEREMRLSLSEIETYGDSAYEGIVWALLNTQQFIFVQ